MNCGYNQVWTCWRVKNIKIHLLLFVCPFKLVVFLGFFNGFVYFIFFFLLKSSVECWRDWLNFMSAKREMRSLTNNTNMAKATSVEATNDFCRSLKKTKTKTKNITNSINK